MNDPSLSPSHSPGARVLERLRWRNSPSRAAAANDDDDDDDGNDTDSHNGNSQNSRNGSGIRTNNSKVNGQEGRKSKRASSSAKGFHDLAAALESSMDRPRNGDGETTLSSSSSSSLSATEKLLSELQVENSKEAISFLKDVANHYPRNRILMELEAMVNYAPEGMYIMPSFDSLTVLNGVLFLHSGFYKGAIFRFTVFLGEKYPDVRPSVVFRATTFHPLIHPRSGEFGLSHRFPTWKPNIDCIHHILAFVHDEFSNVSIKGALNPEASYLFVNNVEEFARRAAQCAQLSSSPDTVYQPPSISTSIQFSSLTPAHYERVCRTIQQAEQLCTGGADLTDPVVDQSWTTCVKEGLTAELSSSSAESPVPDHD